MANRVFEDRLGVWVISPANLPDRLPKLKALGLVDVFLPRDATPADVARVKAGGCFAHVWAARDGLNASDYANRFLLDNQRLAFGGADLNIEGVADAQLGSYIREVVTLIRAQLRHKRLRLNIAPWKGFALPGDLLVSDGALYACEQNYLGNMDELLSPADVLRDMERGALGLTPDKLTVCYAAACRVRGSTERLRTLPDLSRMRRGVVFTDDLMAEAGLL